LLATGSVLLVVADVGGVVGLATHFAAVTAAFLNLAKQAGHPIIVPFLRIDLHTLPLELLEMNYKL